MPRTSVDISLDGDDVLVDSVDLHDDRMSRMYFESILGATRTDTGYRCPRRGKDSAALVVDISTYLERKGWTVLRHGRAQELAQRDVERRRSFARAKDAALALRAGTAPLTADDVSQRLRDFGWDEHTRTLKPYQMAGAIHAVTAANAANFSVPGSGKTATTLALAGLHLSAQTADVVVVVGPLSSFRPWETESRLALPGKLRVRRVRGNLTERTQMYSETQRLDLLLLSYSTAARDRRQLVDLCTRFNVILVVDESHRVKRFRGGFWAPALVQVARAARVRVILSGTPMPQSGKDLYSQLNILWPDRELTGPPEDFASRVTNDFQSVLETVRPFVSRTPKSALGLEPYEVMRHRVELRGTEADIYDLIESNFRRRIENAAQYHDKIEALRRGRPIRLMQAATNADLLNRVDGYYNVPAIESPNPTLMDRLSVFSRTETPAKSEMGLKLVSDIAATQAKVVVWSNFLGNLDLFSRLIRDRIGIPSFQIDGRVPVGDETRDDDPLAARVAEDFGDTRESLIERFLNTSGAAALVANPASCSESISLHSTCHNAVYLDRTYDCALFLQSIDRVHRLGLPEGARVRIHIVQATFDGRGTIDDLVDASLGVKEAMMRGLLEGAELQPILTPEDPLVAAQGDERDLDALLRFLMGEDG